MPSADPTDATTSPEGSVTLEVTPGEDPQAVLGELTRAIVRHPQMRVDYPAADLWLVNLDVDAKDEAEAPRFRAILNEMTSGRVVEAVGRLEKPETVELRPTSRESPPREEEHSWAVDILRRDEELAAALDRGEVVAYRPLPPLASVAHVDGTAERVVTVGLRRPDGQPRHLIMGARTSDGSVVTGPAGVGGPSEAEAGMTLDEAVSASAPATTEISAMARVQVTRGGEPLWDLVVVRPAASTGTNGSGVELRDVAFQERKVLSRAHLPIVNTRFHDDGAPLAATREWLNEESPFIAVGRDVVPGFRVCSQRPVTVADGAVAGPGDFTGVALYLDGDDLVLVSQMRAGWNRYAMEWRLDSDGTINPRITFAEVANPATVGPHTRHGYFRFDLDITEPAGNQVQEHNDPALPATLSPWVTAKLETSRGRDAAHDRRWRVRHYRNGLGYTVVPGPDDGVADDFGAGDVWLVAYHPDEVDDGQGFTTDPNRARAQIDRFLSGEHLGRTDLVVWYGVHLDRPGGEDGPVSAGPRLEAFNWKPPSKDGPFAPLVPPSRDEPLPVIPQ